MTVNLSITELHKPHLNPCVYEHDYPVTNDGSPGPDCRCLPPVITLHGSGYPRAMCPCGKYLPSIVNCI